MHIVYKISSSVNDELSILGYCNSMKPLNKLNSFLQKNGNTHEFFIMGEFSNQTQAEFVSNLNLKAYNSNNGIILTFNNVNQSTKADVRIPNIVGQEIYFSNISSLKEGYNEITLPPVELGTLGVLSIELNNGSYGFIKIIL